MSSCTRALMLLVVIVTAFGLRHGARLEVTGLIHSDEVLAGERAREMVVRGDPGLVTVNFRPDYHKPPLQYWLSAWLLATTEAPERAVRIPAWLFSCGTILFAGLVAGRWCPETPWIMPLTGLLLAGNLVVGLYAGIGILEPGQVFFLLIVLLGLPVASRPARWWLVAAGCALGALQKLPVGFALWLVIIIGDAIRTRSWSMARASAKPAALALLVAAVWPLLQVMRDLPGVIGTHQGELAKLAGWSDHPFAAWWQYGHALWTVSPVLTTVAVAGCLLLFIVPRIRRRQGLIEVALFALCWLVGISVAQVKHPHYMLTLLPLFALLATVPTALFLARWPTLRAASGIALVAAVLFVEATRAVPAYPDLAEQRTLVASVRDAWSGGETLTLVGFDPAAPYHETITAEYLLFYSGSTGPVLRVPVGQASTLLHDTTISRGIAGRREFDLMVAQSPRFQAVDTTRHFVHWVERPADGDDESASHINTR
jgi:4-amino-4-deoxy-L-arabinose transferase-like glycosyltransferase